MGGKKPTRSICNLSIVNLGPQYCSPIHKIISIFSNQISLPTKQRLKSCILSCLVRTGCSCFALNITSLLPQQSKQVTVRSRVKREVSCRALWKERWYSLWGRWTSRPRPSAASIIQHSPPQGFGSLGPQGFSVMQAPCSPQGQWCPTSPPFQHNGVPRQAPQREPWQKPVPSQGAPETRSGPARREPEPHFLWAGRGEAESISCCAAEAGGDVTAFTLPRLAATRGPEFSPSPGEWPGAPRRWKDPRLRGGVAPRIRSSACLPGPACPGPAAPPPASSPGWGERRGFPGVRGSTFLGQVSLLNS